MSSSGFPFTDDNSSSGPQQQVGAPAPAPNAQGGGFAALVRKIAPIAMNVIQSVGGGYAAAAGNPRPAEMILQQRQFQQQQQEKELMDASVENERAMRIAQMGQEMQEQRDRLRAQPPRTWQELMNANIAEYQAKKKIDLASKEPQTFQTADGRMWYKGDPGQPSVPVTVPAPAPTNYNQIRPGNEGPLSPSEAQTQLPPVQAMGKAEGAPKAGVEDNYRDFASDPKYAGKPWLAAHDYLALQNQGKIGVQQPALNQRSAQDEINDLQKMDEGLEKQIKDATEASETAPKAERQAATTRLQELRQRQSVVKDRLDKAMGTNTSSNGPASSTKTRDGIDPSTLKPGAIIYDKQGNPQKFKSYDKRTGKITVE